MNYIKIGFIKKPHGLQGELKILPLTDTPSRFHQIKRLFLLIHNDFIPKKVIRVKILPEEILLQLEGVFDRDAADVLKGAYIYIERSEAVSLNEWEFFTQDLIGLNVYYKEDKIGEVVNILNSGANDNLEIQLENGKTVYYPFLRKFIEKIEMENKRIDINQYEGFFD